MGVTVRDITNCFVTVDDGTGAVVSVIENWTEDYGPNYQLGDYVYIMGEIVLAQVEPLVTINMKHCGKLEDVNFETLWILEVRKKDKM